MSHATLETRIDSFPVPAKLDKIGIAVTGTCTLSCRYCSANSSPGIHEHYSLDEVDQMVQLAAARGARHLFITGGEPLLHPEIHLIVRDAVDLGLHVGTSTNGELVDQSILRRLADAGLVDDFGVTIDGPKASVHDRTRGRGSFAKALRAMYELGKFGGINWGVNYVATSSNLGNALPTAELAQRFGATAINIIRFIPIGRGRHTRDQLWIDSDAYRAEVASLSSRFPMVGKYFEDCAIFELREGSGLRYLFEDNETPLGVSVLHDGRTFMTPAGLALGNARELGLGPLISRLWSDPSIRDRYAEWILEDHHEIVNNSGERK